MGDTRHGRDVTEHYQSGLARIDEPAAPEAVPDEPDDMQTPELKPSASYRTLAELHDRGSTSQDITRALTDRLPPAVSNPGGLARNRLEGKMPPKKAKVRQKAARRACVSRVIMACVTCDADERTTEITNGICRECHAEFEAEEANEPEWTPIPETFLPSPVPEAGVVDVTHWADEVRRAGGLRSKAGMAL
ncbi:hypothetical protein [Streptomyces sp. GESEQ-35]|uniref:hypothetical protein n=1 Tax=Streptomyces sp. GESEQ-35 TaxID=2812657 RepID=UPI001FF58A40|nr:hypothetical protein [Streptomyces sp. GESEQ-35]